MQLPQINFRVFTFLAFLCCSNFTIAQTALVRGVVSDITTGEPLIQAAVIYGAGESKQGTLTDFDGNYSIRLTPGTYELRVSYVGYEPMSRNVIVSSGETYEVNFKMNTLLLREAEVVTDIAIERETPVAFSNIKPLQIQEELGSQPIPMILNSTPGVYATQAGSDDNGPSISIRGFKQRNVSVLIDGIPVNDMETGGVYWNNWFGLDLVTQTMQVQRGLGASKLALPAIGGTVNIITQGIENKRSTSVKQELASFGTTRTTIGHTSGRLGDEHFGYGYTLSGSYKKGGGFPDESFTDSWFYYGKFQMEFGKNMLSFTATGSPSKNSARAYQQRIATHSKDFARELFTGTDEEYAQMVAYSQAYHEIFNNGTLSLDEEQEAYSNLNTAYGYNSDSGASEFEDQMTATNFIDTTGIIEYGPSYNVHWGELNGERIYERQNKYFKPLYSLRHSFRASEKFYINTTFYMSNGVGGGTRLDNPLGSGDYSADGQVDFQKFYDTHTTPNIFGQLPIDQQYSDSLVKSSRILRKMHNNHNWVGALATFRFDAAEKLVVSGGLDWRTYKGEHYSTVYDLLGGHYFVDAENANDSDHMHFVGDTIGYHNESYVRWGGAFALLEYKTHRFNTFLNLSAVYQDYKRSDFFLSPEDQTTDWKRIPGYTIKAGGNLNASEWIDVYANLGHLNRTPVFRNVIDFSNNFVGNIENEKINSVELGVKFSKYPFSSNLNVYFTDWQNRPLNSLLRVETPDGDILRANINSMSAFHQGVEWDFAYQIGRDITLEGFTSYGDWRWTSSSDSLQLIDQDTNTPYLNEEGDPVTISYNANGVSVGDAPQSQFGLAFRYKKNGFYIKPRFTYFDRFYADFDPFSLYDENEGRQSWKMPAYGLLDLHTGYTMKLNESQIDYRLSMYNILNTTYLINAQNNDPHGEWYFNNGQTYAFTENNFDAASASVYMGYGFRMNFSVRVRF